MGLNVNTIITSSSEIMDVEDSIKMALDSKWDDPVHESFYGFVEDLQNTRRKFEQVSSDLQNVAQRVDNIDISLLLNKFNSLKSKIKKRGK